MEGGVFGGCSVESAVCGECSAWRVERVEGAVCRECSVWRVQCVESAVCGGCSVWRVQCVLIKFLLGR